MVTKKRFHGAVELWELWTFVSLTLGGAWLSAWCVVELAGLRATRYTFATRLLTASWTYLLVLSWQPLVAARIVGRLFGGASARRRARGPASMGFVLLGAGGALALCAAAAFCARLLGGWCGSMLRQAAHSAEPFVSSARPGWQLGVVLFVAWLLTLACLWLQAVCEELGFRGYCLERSIELLGTWRGVWAHGAVWGLWYLPLLLFTHRGPALRASDLAVFVTSCVLLGVLLAWLRLAARSIVPGIAANVVVTLGAGLPYLLHGMDTGARGELFGAPGVAVMALAMGLLVSSVRLRGLVGLSRA